VSAHTPGPWVVEHCYAGGRTVCQMRSPDKLVCVNASADSQGPYLATLENARLMAAAPDLLEALKEVRRFLDHDEPVRIAASAHDRQLMETVDAAIAKAEGRSE